MYEYLQALYQRFFRETEHIDLHEKINTLRQELKRNMGNEERKLLDVQNYLKNDVSLESVAAGFKLAAGIAKELEANGLYFYDAEVEKKVEWDMEQKHG